jgi:hypothetical protein
VVAGLFDQVVQTGPFAAKHEDAVGFEIESGVIRRPALVQPQNPYIFLLELFERTDEVSDAGDADVLGGSGGGLGDGRGDGSGPALGEDDSVYSGAVGGAKERAEVVGVLDAVQSKEEMVLAFHFWGQKIFNSEKLTLADDCQHSLVGIRPGKAGELVTGFERDPDSFGLAELDQPFKTLIAPLPGDAYMIELARAGTDGLLDRVQTVKNFHELKSTPQPVPGT